MTTRRFLQLLAATGLAGAAGCVRRRPDLMIGVSCGVVPWCYIEAETGVFTGFDVELARAVCARAGLNPIFRSIVWAEKERLLFTGKIDCVWSNFTITGRTDRYTVLGPYASNALVVLTREDSEIRANADLAGKVVFVQAGSTCEAALAPRGAAAALGAKVRRVRALPDVAACIQRLLEGLGDAVVLDEELARVWLRERPGRLRLVADGPLARDEFGVGFRPSDTVLRDRLSEALRELQAEGVCAELSERFFGRADWFSYGKGAR